MMAAASEGTAPVQFGTRCTGPQLPLGSAEVELALPGCCSWLSSAGRRMWLALIRPRSPTCPSDRGTLRAGAWCRGGWDRAPPQSVHAPAVEGRNRISSRCLATGRSWMHAGNNSLLREVVGSARLQRPKAGSNPLRIPAAAAAQQQQQSGSSSSSPPAPHSHEPPPAGAAPA